MEPTKIIPLTQSVSIGSAVYSEIKLREPIVNEVITSFKNAYKDTGEASTASSYDAQILLVAIVSSIPKEALEAFPSRILDQAIEYLTSFQDQNGEVIKSDQWNMELDDPLPLSGTDGDILIELSLQEPTVGQRKKAMKQFDTYGQGIVGGLEFQATLLTEVSSQKLATILKLPMGQFTKATNYLMRFFPDIKKAGQGLFSN